MYYSILLESKNSAKNSIFLHGLSAQVENILICHSLFVPDMATHQNYGPHKKQTKTKTIQQKTLQNKPKNKPEKTTKQKPPKKPLQTKKVLFPV